jgi:1-phosphofructokinase
MIYTVTLNPALDYVMQVGTLRYDDINRSKDETLYYGGKGINVSVVLSRLGIENRALGFAAGFTGKQLDEMLRADGIDTDFIYLAEGITRINVKIKADTELDINAVGPSVNEAEVETLLRKLDEVGSGDYLVLAGSVPKTLPEDIYERILQRLAGKDVRFIVDATGDLLLKVLKYKPFLVKPNHHELGDLFGVETKTDEAIEHYAKELQKMGAVNVLVSRSKDGAMLIDENGGVSKIGNAKGTLVNSVGCGDSMVAGFTAGCIEKGDYAYALRLGAACGNATAFSQGLAEKEDVERIFNLLDISKS